MDRIRTSGFYEKLRAWESEMRNRFPDPHEYMAHRFNMDTWEKSELYALQRSIPRPPLSRLIDHLDRMVELAGIDCVGVGTDYDLGSVPSEIEFADDLPNLTRALVERGYGDDDIKKIWGGNFLRVLNTIDS